MKYFKKTQIAVGAVMLATVGIAMSTAQAESLLAPLVIQGTNGWNTYFAFKVGKIPTNAAGQGRIHYTYLRKNVGLGAGMGIGALEKLTQACEMENNWGSATPGDIIYQRADGAKQYYTAQPAADASLPNGYTAGPFVGMMVISTGNDQDGDMSGFGYLVNAAAGAILDYKLLNNHHSRADGDFSIGFISKTAIDYMWLSSNPTGPVAAPVTGWTTSVTGPDMAKHGTQADGKEYSSWYDATVRISQQRRGDNDSPTDMVDGVFDNDEVVISGSRPLVITCMGTYSHSAFITPLQNTGTQWGGWTRKSVTDITPADPNYEDRKASGAFTYRSDSNVIGFSNYTTLQVETGGHLAKGHNHVNRPY